MEYKSCKVFRSKYIRTPSGVCDRPTVTFWLFQNQDYSLNTILIPASMLFLKCNCSDQGYAKNIILWFQLLSNWLSSCVLKWSDSVLKIKTGIYKTSQTTHLQTSIPMGLFFMLIEVLTKTNLKISQVKKKNFKMLFRLWKMYSDFLIREN